MKLKQNEFCHNCNKYVDFEFDDTTEKQVIICPNCSHEHWRELDMGTIINVRAAQGTRFIYRPKQIEFKSMFLEIDEIAPNNINFNIEKLEVIGQDKNGNAVVKDSEGKSATISNRRWGRDRRQG